MDSVGVDEEASMSGERLRSLGKDGSCPPPHPPIRTLDRANVNMIFVRSFILVLSHSLSSIRQRSPATLAVSTTAFLRLQRFLDLSKGGRELFGRDGAIQSFNCLPAPLLFYFSHLNMIIVSRLCIIGLFAAIEFGASENAAKSFTVYRFTPTTNDQVEFLRTQFQNNSRLDFWKAPTQIGAEVHVMANSEGREDLISASKRLNMATEVMIEDVEKVIKERAEESTRRRSTASGQRMRDAPNGPSFNLAQYHSFGEVINYLNDLAIRYPDRVHVIPIGTTHEGRQIPLIKIGTSKANKPAIWIDGGIHAREWISPAVVLYMINQLVTSYDWDTRMRQLVDDLDWYIVPLLNPDGYEHSRSSTNPDIRLWRKNRSPLICPQNQFSSILGVGCCQGVDLNRNFDWHWGQTGSSTDPCSEIYQGATPFSEPETRAVRDFVSSRRGSIHSFLTFHSYSQILMYPFGHERRIYPQDVQELRSTALDAASALRQLYGTNYVVGTGADTLYPASGGSEDWAKGKLGVKYSYLFELRPEEHVWDGFLLAENQILPTSKETFEAVKVIADSVIRSFPKSTGLPSTVVSPTCEDKDTLCGYWSRNGACTIWPNMRERCPRSCGVCGGAKSTLRRKSRKDCVDERSDCAALKRMDLCSDSNGSCQKTCGFCS
uniref:ShKT domain-containing protein n=1 Tax=Plectus sambesii TaxID=2011161 RepID=A0A914XAY4_9BILA